MITFTGLSSFHGVYGAKHSRVLVAVSLAPYSVLRTVSVTCAGVDSWIFIHRFIRPPLYAFFDSVDITLGTCRLEVVAGGRTGRGTKRAR
jgi:hypothetical protein